MNPTPELSYIRILPELILSACGLIVMLVEPLLPQRSSHKSLGIFSLFGTLLALVASLYQTNYPGWGWFNMIRVDEFSVFFHVTICAISSVVILASFEYLETQQIRGGEYYGLILFGTVGMVLMSSAVELVLIFIALEISSIATYVLAGYRHRAATSAESSIKYFLLGSFATAFFLYGVALMFGATGSTSIYTISSALQSGQVALGSSVAPVSYGLAYVAVALMFVGLGFKVASAPFHVWTPDVYEGAPAPVVALMSTAPKAAAFAVLLRILFGAAIDTSKAWFWLVWISAALSMTLGNFGALLQNNVKRMLAYSSIAHSGYLLIAFAAVIAPNARDTGISAAIFYAASYAAMNVGAFAAVSHFARTGERYVNFEDYAGLGKRSPLLAATLTIFLLSLLGLPATGGFFAKFYVFNAAIKSDLIWLTIIGLINSAVASYYYLRLIVVMYMYEPQPGEEKLEMRAAPGLTAALVITAIITIWLGVRPAGVLDYATRGASRLLPSFQQSSSLSR
ncbi:MAG: NADH-quinone oxidoreductase subunit N [Acidobacteria bacterium]|nr:MAG: NADH-quinone oxidoreductase subunit N [Acidobacteriota bacterium]